MDAEDKKAKQALKQYDGEYLTCREVNHLWQSKGFDRRPGKAGIARVMWCPRCDTERHDVYNVLGEVMEQRYVYPHGYKVEDGGVKKRHARQEAMRRAGLRLTVRR
jgi:hypothetical protein